MKKLATLILAAGMVFSAATGASAIDFKAKGQWIMSFDYGEGGAFERGYKNNASYGWGNGRGGKSQDEFEASQRVRLQLDAVASEALSGTVYFEIGRQWWGNGSNTSSGGGALGADGNTVIKLKNAYIDWMIPDSDARVRMGLQHVTFPSYTIGASTVMDEDVAGVTVSYKVNDQVGITVGWMRPYNDNFAGGGVTSWNGAKHFNDSGNFMDNADFGYLLVPLTFDGAKVTPWGMYGAIGPNTFRSNPWNGETTARNDAINDANNKKNDPYPRDGQNSKYGWTYPNYQGNFVGAADNYARGGLFPVGGSLDGQGRPKYRKLNNYADAWWLGATGEFTIWDPFRIAWDFTYGSVTWADNGSLNRQGWLASLLVEYKMDWGIPGIYGWYGSGDDNNPANGSERLPTISSNNTNDFSHYAFNGDPYIARDGVISSGDMGGTWGIGIRLKDMSFIENLKHTFRVNYISGTNSTSMAKKISTAAGIWANGSGLDGYDGRGYYGAQGPSGAAIGFDGMYLTTEDHALEFGLTNTYKMYENFTIALEADYIAMWLDTGKSVWGARHKAGQSIPTTMDSWNINASFVYSF